MTFNPERRQKTMPRGRENRGVVANGSDRPEVPVLVVENPDAARIVGDATEQALKPQITLKRGAVIGGGTSREATSRARRKMAANGTRS